MIGKKKPNPKTCEKCPRRFDPNGCEKWIDSKNGFKETNEITKEERVVEGCFYEVIPKLMVHLVKSCNETTAAANSARNKTVDLGGILPILLMNSNQSPEQQLKILESSDQFKKLAKE